jgi:predicted nucleic acid-binding OB-fold protein
MADLKTLSIGYALVLDYRNKPSLNAILVHAISERNFMLLELLGKPESKFSTLERIYIDSKYDEKIKPVVSKRLQFKGLMKQPQVEMQILYAIE